MTPLRVTDYKPGSSMLPHHHDGPSLIVVIEGGYQERIQGSITEQTPGHMLFYPAYATHSQQFGKSGARKIVFTPPSSSLDYLVDHGIAPGAARHIQSSTIAPLASRLLAELRHNDDFSPLAAEGLLLELVAAFARGNRKDGPAAPRWIRSIRDAIHGSPDRSDSLEDIAARIGRHPVHLAREFRRYFGTSIGAYRRRLRLEKAATLLRLKNADLADIALACGFASHSHLCRSFRVEYGMTPSEYRKSL